MLRADKSDMSIFKLAFSSIALEALDELNRRKMKELTLVGLEDAYPKERRGGSTYNKIKRSRSEKEADENASRCLEKINTIL